MWLQVSDSVRYSKRSPQHQSSPSSGNALLPTEFQVESVPVEPVPGSSKERHTSPDISLFNRLPPEVFGKAPKIILKWTMLIPKVSQCPFNIKKSS